MRVRVEVHEYTMTSWIVQGVLREAERRKAKRVTEVQIVIGELTFLNPDQVRFWYDILTKDTVMDGSRLIIEIEPGRVKCPKCGYEGRIRCDENPLYHIMIPTLLCPKCNGIAEIQGGRDCIIKSIRLVV